MAIDHGGERPSARWALAGLSLSTLMSSLGTSIANVALPALAQAFDAPFQEVQWIVLAYLIAMTTLTVSAGRLGDRIGRRRVLLAGILLFTAASTACALAPTLWLLAAARATQGLGAAIMMAMTLALASELMPAARTGGAMGLLGTMSAIGTALGPSLGGVLIAGAGWRAVFLVNLPLGVATFLIAGRHLPIDQARAVADRAAFDRRGTPMLTLLHDRLLAANLITNALVSAVMMATLVVGPFYLSNGLGLGAAAIGFAMSAGPLVTALTSVLAGRLIDRIGAPVMTLAGLVTLAGGALFLVGLPAGLGVAGYVGPIVVMTMGYALFQTANNTAVMTNVRTEERGAISGHAQPLSQPRADCRRVGSRRRLCHGRGGNQPGHGHAGNVRRRRPADRRRGRHRGWKPRSPIGRIASPRATRGRWPRCAFLTRRAPRRWPPMRLR